MPKPVFAAVHLALLLVLPPLLVGVVNRVKAWFAGRRGPPLLQLYFDLFKLWRKGVVLGRPTTVLFLAGPVAALATALVAGLLVPMGAGPAPLAFQGDLVLFACLLALGRFFTVSAALDTGSAFEGMGASREAAFACLAEPALFLGLVSLVRLAGGSLSLSALLSAGSGAWAATGGVLVLVLAAWVLVLLVENCRVPFDDPNTHLELTMIHEVMALDHGGPPLALVLWGAALKLWVFGALVLGLLLPAGGAGGVAAFVAGQLLLAAGIGVVESVMARLRLTRVPQLLMAANLLAGFGVVLLLR